MISHEKLGTAGLEMSKILSSSQTQIRVESVLQCTAMSSEQIRASIVKYQEKIADKTKNWEKSMENLILRRTDKKSPT